MDAWVVQMSAPRSNVAPACPETILNQAPGGDRSMKRVELDFMYDHSSVSLATTEGEPKILPVISEWPIRRNRD